MLLRDWQVERGISAATLAAELRIKPGTFGSYLTHLADIKAGRNRPSASARAFQFTKQSAETQTAIADLLAKPVDFLRSMSLGEQIAEGSPPMVASTALNRLGNRSALPEFSEPSQLRFAIAQAIEGLPGVGAVAVVGEWRGKEYRFLDQHQIPVYAEPDANIPELRNQISAELDRLNLPGSWEHGSKQPATSMTLGRQLVPVGSIVSPWVAAPRDSRSGLLVRLRNEQLASHRIGVVASGPYAGSVPVGSYLAASTGAGYLRFEDLVRLANAELSRTASVPSETSQGRARPKSASARTALAESEHDINAGFLGHRALVAMSSGEVAGAWVTAMEVNPLDLYEPINNALTILPDLLVLLRYGPGWDRMAAWRMASVDLDVQARSGCWKREVSESVRVAAMMNPPIWSSDCLEVELGHPRAASKESLRAIRSVLELQVEVAANWYDKIRHWERTLVKIERRRREQGKLTISVTLDALPPDSRGYSFDGGDGFERPDRDSDQGRLIFQDRLEQVVDAWVVAAAKVLHVFAYLSDVSVEQYAQSIRSEPPLRAFAKLRENGYRPQDDPSVTFSGHPSTGGGETANG